MTSDNPCHPDEPSRQDPRHKELVEWLKSQGHDDRQIERIVAKVVEYDNRTLHESIFDS